MNKGFTLLEVLIVTIIISLIIPMMASLFIVNIMSYSRVQILQEVKDNGDFVLDTVETKMRRDIRSIYSNAAATVEVCTVTSSLDTPESYSGQLYFRDDDQAIFYLAEDSGVIEFTQNGDNQSLTNNLVNASNLTMSCSRSSIFSNPIISIQFDVQQRSGAKFQDMAFLTFSTKFKTR